MLRVARIEGAVNEHDQMVCIVADGPWNEMLRACGLGPDEDAQPAICHGCVDEGTGCDAAQVAECYQREEGDVAHSSGEVD